MIAHLLRIKAGYSRWRDPPPEAARLDDVIAQLEAVREEAIMVTLGDDTASEFGWIRFAIIPEEPMIIGFSCGQHEDKATPLVRRVVDVLGYNVVID